MPTADALASPPPARTPFALRLFQLLCAAQAGAQLFFILAAQIIFTKDVAALPHEHPRRILAADLVGQLLARLDASALAVSSITVLLAILLARDGKSSLRRALQPLLAGLCAVISMLVTTPAIQAMRLENRTTDPSFGRLHALSSVLLLLEIILFTWGAMRDERSAA